VTRARIEAVGAYAPRARITAAEVRDALGTFAASGIERTAVPDADEDALTMAYESATRALDAADRDGDEIGFLALGTTTPPMAEEELLPRLAGMVGAPRTATTRTLAGSTRAGVQALVDGVEAVPGDAVGLVVASDAPRGAPESATEHAAGAGAAAFVLSSDGAARIADHSQYAEPYPGTRFREHGSEETTGLGIASYDWATYRTTLSGAVESLDADVGDVDAAALQSPDGKLPYRVAGDLGVDADRVGRCSTVETLGDAGAASAPLGLARALAGETDGDDGIDRALVGGYGSGAGATALLVEVERDVPTALDLDAGRDLSFAEYLRRRGDLSSGPPEGGGAYVSVPNWQRTLPQRYRLKAGRCPECGALAFPPEGACTGCGTAVEYETVRLPGTGEIEAVTTIERGGAPPEFAEQQSRSGPYDSAIVAFDGPEGESVSVPAQVLAPDDGPPQIGDRVAATIRRLYEQEGVIRYGFKVRALDGE